MTKIVNLTKHTVSILGTDSDTGEENWCDIDPEGAAVRIDIKKRRLQEVSIVMNDGSGSTVETDIQIKDVSYGRIYNLPDAEEGILLIVPRVVAQALPERRDLLILDEYEHKRTGDGSYKLVGARCLSTIARPVNP